MWISVTAVAGTRAKVSISGARSRSGARASAALSSSSSATPSTTTRLRPRRKSGSSGSGGNRMIRSEVVISSGAVTLHCAQARSTSPARPRSHSSMPAYTSAIG